MQFKVIRHRNKDGSYRKGYRVQCLRRVREVTPDFPEGKNVQRVVAKFDRAARELPAEVAAVLTPSEQAEWKEWRVKQDEEHLKSVAQYELDTLAERLGVIRTGIQKGYAATDSKNAVAIRTGARAVLRLLADLMPEPVKGRPVEEEYLPQMLPNFATPGTPEFDSYQRVLAQGLVREGHPAGGTVLDATERYLAARYGAEGLDAAELERWRTTLRTLQRAADRG